MPFLKNGWRTHTIVPIHKADDKAQATNYRPISLLSTVSKVLEQLVYNNVIPYISGFFTSQQFGFLYCTTAATYV